MFGMPDFILLFLYWNENRKTELMKKAELTVDQKEEVLEREATEEAAQRDAAGKISGRDTAEEITEREVLVGEKALTEQIESAVSELTDTVIAEKLEQRFLRALILLWELFWCAHPVI